MKNAYRMPAPHEGLPPALRIDSPALKNPRVSIVVNNYNYGRFLDCSLRSAVEQTNPCEVVVVDDGSTDESAEVLHRWQEKVKVIRQPNSGQIAAYEAGFRASTGEVVIFLDSDDALDLEAAALASRAFGGGVVKVQFRLRLIDEQGQLLGSVIPRLLGRGDVGSALVKHGLLYPSSPGSGNAYRRSALEKLFPLPRDERDRHGADFFCVYGAAMFGLVSVLEGVLGSYRIHAAGAANNSFALRFGNAGRDADQALLFKRRALRFHDWIGALTGGTIKVPERLLDFSHQKALYAHTVLDAKDLSDRFRHGRHELKWLLRALWLRSEDNLARKVALTIWAMAVLLMPGWLARPLALYVCNPASR